MRLDYALYGLAIILFVLTAITYIFVAESDGRIFYVAATAIVGILSIVGGYFMRPKTTAAPLVTAPQAEPVEPVQNVVPTVEEPKSEVLTVEEPKVEASSAKNPQIQTAPAVQSPEVEVPEVAVTHSEPAQVSEPSVAAEVAPAKVGLMQIRGISEKRAEQLKANGINTIEELADASADDLAQKLSVSPKIVKMWIGSAKKLRK
jgi:predicted flap endonuclease-1-like 5' DNA nuclease